MSWQPKNIKTHGVDDMALLTKTDASAIVENLKKRLLNDTIYTYIGSVLIAVNPFKNIPIYSDKEITLYQESAYYENPPHIYALGDNMYRCMLANRENQCVIISGESGAGKTVSAKHVMNQISKISGGGEKANNTKQVILDSNPLLEAFGNAKTLRNNNSSRFGKYVEIQFSGSQPVGGSISNFLLEKARVVSANKEERSFHIFYQVIAGCSKQERDNLGLGEASYFDYLSQTRCYNVDGVDDVGDYEDVKHAMNTVKIPQNVQKEIFEILAAILHLGNIHFDEHNNGATPSDEKFLSFPSFLLDVKEDMLKEKLLTRLMESKWGNKTESILAENNVEQANFCRDALAKTLYSRIFDYLVESINTAIVVKGSELVNIGILDIYGFEIFRENGFEQFCINYVNEKLQQIFIELTLKKEQDEYNEEGIKWSPIKYTDNKQVCELIENKSSPCGIISLMDDACNAAHATSDGADNKYTTSLSAVLSQHPCIILGSATFTIKHYAGNVMYEIRGMCEKNRDVLNQDLITLMRSSSKTFLLSLFPENKTQEKTTKRPVTNGTQIRNQANNLVEKLMKCQPHYIRCIKPNETKKAHDFDDKMVTHQVEYQGLPENVRIKRAGWAYRREFAKFMTRYSVLTDETRCSWRGSVQDGCKHIMEYCGLTSDQFQMGRTKVFIQKAESLFLLEERMQRVYDIHATRIQTYWKKNHTNVATTKKSFALVNIYRMRKQRQFGSICRNFFMDYLGLEHNPEILSLIERKEKVVFAQCGFRLNRKFKLIRCEILQTTKNIYVIGREKVKKGPQKGQIIMTLDLKLPIPEVKKVTMSSFQDCFMLIHPSEGPCTMLSCTLKSEFIFTLSQSFSRICGRDIDFSVENTMTFEMKKEGITFGKQVTVEFKESSTLKNTIAEAKGSFNKCTINVAPGEPANTDPAQFMRNRRNDSRYRDAKFNTTYTPISSSSNRGFSNNGLNNGVMGGGNTCFEQKKFSNNEGPSREGRSPLPNPNNSRPTPSCPPGRSTNTHVALYEYAAGDKTELSFNAGTEMMVLEKEDSGWYKAKIGDKVGFVPGNYIKEL